MIRILTYSIVLYAIYSRERLIRPLKRNDTTREREYTIVGNCAENSPYTRFLLFQKRDLFYRSLATAGKWYSSSRVAWARRRLSDTLRIRMKVTPRLRRWKRFEMKSGALYTCVYIYIYILYLYTYIHAVGNGRNYGENRCDTLRALFARGFSRFSRKTNGVCFKSRTSQLMRTRKDRWHFAGDEVKFRRFARSWNHLLFPRFAGNVLAA